MQAAFICRIQVDNSGANLTEPFSGQSANRDSSMMAHPDWRRPAIILAVSLLLTVAIFVVSFTFPTLELGYLTVSLVTLLLASLAQRSWDGLDGGPLSILLFARLCAVLLAIVSLFDAMDWSFLGEKRDGESGFAIGLILSFFFCVRSLRRLFPKPNDRGAVLLGLIFLAASITFAAIQVCPGILIDGLNTLCAIALVLILLPEVRRTSLELSPGLRLALNVGAAYTILNSLTRIYPDELSGKIWVWLLWCLACIASRRGTEAQTPGVAVMERMLLGVGIFVFSIDGAGQFPGVSMDSVLVPASLFASLPLLQLLGGLNGKGSTLLCWMSLLTVGAGIGSAASAAGHLPQASQFLAGYIVPLILVAIALRHLWLRYRSGVRPLFISGTRGFPPLSFRGVPRALLSVCTLLTLAAAFLLPSWMLVTNTSPTKLLAGLHGTPFWPGLPLFVTLAMHDEYYYYDKVPWRRPVPGDANAVIESLWHNPPDKFSYYNAVSLQDELERYKPVKGKKADARLNFFYRKHKQSGILRIEGIHPDSPLEKADIHRGDELLAVNNKPVNPGQICHEVGETVSLTVRTPAGMKRHVAVACTAATPFKPFHRVIASESGPVGYLFLARFRLNEYAGIESHITALQKSGIRRLVLDLRYNGGGMVANEMDLDARLLGSRFKGANLSRTFHNRKYRDRDSIETVPDVNASLGINQLVVLTSDETCSASEALINDLKPYVTVGTVGAATCGKPMMMEVKTIGHEAKGARLELVTAELKNSRGEGAFFKGIPPDCSAADDGNYDLGDPREKLLHEALHLLETGKCSK